MKLCHLGKAEARGGHEQHDKAPEGVEGDETLVGGHGRGEQTSADGPPLPWLIEWAKECSGRHQTWPLPLPGTFVFTAALID